MVKNNFNTPYFLACFEQSINILTNLLNFCYQFMLLIKVDNIFTVELYTFTAVHIFLVR